MTPVESIKGEVRSCPRCEKNVHLVENAFELVLAIENNECVSVPRQLILDAKGVVNMNKQLVGHVRFKNDD